MWLFLLLNVLAGDKVLLQYNRSYYNVLQGGMDVGLSFLDAYDVLLGTPGALLDLFSPDKGTGNLNLLTSKSIWTIKIICLQEGHGKDEFLQAIQVLAPQFRFFDIFAFLTMKLREDRLSAFIGTFFLMMLL